MLTGRVDVGDALVTEAVDPASSAGIRSFGGAQDRARVAILAWRGFLARSARRHGIVRACPAARSRVPGSEDYMVAGTRTVEPASGCGCRHARRSRKVERPLDGAPPCGDPVLALVAIHLRIPALSDRVVRAQLVEPGPESGGQTGRIGGAGSRDLGDRGRCDR